MKEGNNYCCLTCGAHACRKTESLLSFSRARGHYLHGGCDFFIIYVEDARIAQKEKEIKKRITKCELYRLLNTWNSSVIHSERVFFLSLFVAVHSPVLCLIFSTAHSFSRAIEKPQCMCKLFWHFLFRSHSFACSLNLVIKQMKNQ